MDFNVCSFTGHREIKSTHQKDISSLLQRAIAFAYAKGCRVFVTGGAVGFDTVAANQVLLFRMSHPDVKLRLFLPCKSQADAWSDKQRDRYEYTLSLADEIVYVSEQYTKTCMKERNLRLAEEADIMIAYVYKDRSGAAQTVRMASKLGKEIYNLYPTLENGG